MSWKSITAFCKSLKLYKNWNTCTKSSPSNVNTAALLRHGDCKHDEAWMTFYWVRALDSKTPNVWGKEEKSVRHVFTLVLISYFFLLLFLVNSLFSVTFCHWEVESFLSLPRTRINCASLLKDSSWLCTGSFNVLMFIFPRFCIINVLLLRFIVAAKM